MGYNKGIEGEVLLMAENSNGVEIPSQFSHSVKLEQTAKGVRITIHVSATDPISARQDAINLYITTQAALKGKGMVVAPIEVKG